MEVAGGGYVACLDGSMVVEGYKDGACCATLPSDGSCPKVTGNCGEVASASGALGGGAVGGGAMGGGAVGGGAVGGGGEVEGSGVVV